jgi:hypothetical protein
MSRNHKRKSDDKTVRRALLAFAVFILVVGTALVINNRSLSFAGTVNGQRIPMAHFRFQFDLVAEGLGQDAWMFDQLTIGEFSFEQLADLNVVTSRGAEEFGIVLSSQDIANSRIEADAIRASMTFNGVDLIRQMGFSRAGFYRFTEMWTLYHLILEEITGRLEVTDEELSEAYEEFLEENIGDYTKFYVYMVEVETEELAEELRQQLLQQVFGGANIIDSVVAMIDAHNVVSLFVDFDDNIASADIVQTNAGAAHMAEVQEMDAANVNISQVAPLTSGNYGFFVLDEIKIEIPEELEEQFKEYYESELRHAFFREYADLWTSQSNISQNARFFRSLQ